MSVSAEKRSQRQRPSKGVEIPIHTNSTGHTAYQDLRFVKSDRGNFSRLDPQPRRNDATIQFHRSRRS
jgi:hypothetical protein